MKDLKVVVKHILLILGMYVILAILAAFLSPNKIGIEMTPGTMQYHQYLLFCSMLAWGLYHLITRK